MTGYISKITGMISGRLLRLLGDIALQIGADFFFDYAVVGFFFFAGMGKRVFDDALGAFHEAVFAGIEAAGHDFGSGLDVGRTTC